MKINTKKLITASLCMIVAGAVLAGIGILLGGWPGVSFSRSGIESPYTENSPYILEKTKLDKFSNIELEIGSYADIRIRPSDDEYFYLEYKLDGDYDKPFYEVRQDTLVLTHKSKRQRSIYFFNIGFSNNSNVNAYVTLYIPEGQDMGRLSVLNDLGDVSVEGLTFGDTRLVIDYGNADLQNTIFDDLELTLDCGALKAESLTAKNILLSNEYGDITLKDVSAREADLKLESGSLKASSFDCGNLTAKNEYGDIDLEDFSAETADLVLESGSLYLSANSLASLTCKNDYGDVEIQLPKDLSDYAINAHSEYGSIKLPDEALQGYHTSSDDEAFYRTEGKAKGSVTIEVESGDITISESITASSDPSDDKKQ